KIYRLYWHPTDRNRQPTEQGSVLQRFGSGGSIASMNWRVYVIVPLLFIAAAAPSALRKDVTQGFDEVAHAFYIANLQSTGETLAIPVTAAFCAFGGRSAGLSLLDAIE